MFLYVSMASLGPHDFEVKYAKEAAAEPVGCPSHLDGETRTLGPAGLATIELSKPNGCRAVAEGRV